MGVSEQYTKKLKKEFDYSATWLPTTIVKPGDIGKLHNYMFEHVATLNDFDIDFEIIDDSSNMEIDYCSSDSVSINFKLSGQAPIPGSSLTTADAGVNIKFSKGKAIVFRLSKCTSTRLANVNAVGEQIISLYNDKKWKKDMVVVNEAVKANSATIIISNSSNAQLDLLAKGEVGSGDIDLADINAEFQIMKKSKIATNIIASEGLTPLFRTAGIKDPIIGGIYFTLGKGKRQKGNAKFGLVDYADFEK
jgi:hypothetical protein